MPGQARTLRRIVKAKDGRHAFRIATVKRDPFKQEYIDLCSSSFEEALGEEHAGRAASTFDQVSARGRHALERSEIIKAQSFSLGKLVSGALRAQASATTAGSSDSEVDAATPTNEDADAGTAAKPAKSVVPDQEDLQRRYKLALAGTPEPLPLSKILGSTPGADFTGLCSSTAPTVCDQSQPAVDSSHVSDVDVGDMIRLQTAPSSELLLRDAPALQDLMDFASPAGEPVDTDGTSDDRFPSNSEVLAMIGPFEEEMFSSEEEDNGGGLVPEGPADDDLALELSEDDMENFAPAVDMALTPSVPAMETRVPEHQLLDGGAISATEYSAGDALHAREAEDHNDNSIPSIRLPVHAASLSASLVAAASTTVAKRAARRTKKSPSRQPKYGKLLIDLRKTAPSIGPPPKTARKVHVPRKPSELSAALATPWSRRQPTQALCAYMSTPCT